MQQAVSNKNSFSDLYQRKLQEKKERKSFFLSQSIAQGDSILKD
jgi:predicted CopG family antitoxin